MISRSSALEGAHGLSPAASSPRIRRSTTGSSSRMSPGTPVRICRDASSTTAPVIAYASCGEASRGATPALGVAAVEVVDVRGHRVERAVAPLHRARAGADDLHQQRLRLVRVARQRPQERAQRGAHARRRVGVDVLRRRVAHVAQERLRSPRRTARRCTPPCWRSARRTWPSTFRPRGRSPRRSRRRSRRGRTPPTRRRTGGRAGGPAGPPAAGRGAPSAPWHVPARPRW